MQYLVNHFGFYYALVNQYIAQAMGLATIAGNVRQSLTGETADASLFAGLKDLMAGIETLAYALTPDRSGRAQG